MNTVFFIIWLIGCIVSLYVIFKYAEPGKFLKSFSHMRKSDSKTIRVSSYIMIFLLIFVIIPFYVLLSWFGAIATYIIFTDRT